ncbi:hypothetical protein GCM10027073_15420 [Streptomyces chlorus]
MRGCVERSPDECGMRRPAFLGIRAPGSGGRREFLTRPASWWPDSQWRDRAGFAPGFLPVAVVAMADPMIRRET